jgi:K+-transporting ATPase ATPase C chain
MIQLTLQSIRQTLLWTLLLGLAYPLAITVFAQLFFRDQANGSLVVRDGQIVGSELLAQPFTGSNYFWPRPSACSYGSSPSGIVASGASNLGPTSGALQTNVLNNIAAFLSGNNLSTNTSVPADMVFASASGLDPHISPEAARLQIARVAAARGLNPQVVSSLVDQFVEAPQWGILGEPRVNVLRLNLALDQLPVAKAQGEMKPRLPLSGQTNPLTQKKRERLTSANRSHSLLPFWIGPGKLAEPRVPDYPYLPPSARARVVAPAALLMQVNCVTASLQSHAQVFDAHRGRTRFESPRVVQWVGCAYDGTGASQS